MWLFRFCGFGQYTADHSQVGGCDEKTAAVESGRSGAHWGAKLCVFSVSNCLLNSALKIIAFVSELGQTISKYEVT